MRNGFAIPFRYSPGAVLDGALHPDWLLRQLRHGLPQLANFVGAGENGRQRPGGADEPADGREFRLG